MNRQQAQELQSKWYATEKKNKISTVCCNEKERWDCLHDTLLQITGHEDKVCIDFANKCVASKNASFDPWAQNARFKNRLIKLGFRVGSYGDMLCVFAPERHYQD